MHTDSKNVLVKDIVSRINELITRRQYHSAERLLRELADISGTMDEDYILLKGYLKRSKILDEKNRSLGGT